MMITRKALPRRTFVRGLGVALGLPMLDAMVPAMSALAQTPASGPRRLGFVYMPNGVAKNSSIDYWTPSNEGKNFAMSQILTPLEPFRDRMLVISGLDQNQAEAGDDGASGDHTRGTSSWLTGVYPKRTEGADVRNGISADQIAASVLGKDTALPSLELGIDLNFLAGQCENSYSCAYLNTLAWTSPTTPLPTENNPRIVFERLFGDGGTRRGASRACAQEAKPAGFGPRGLEPPSAPSRARRSRRRRPTTSMPCARSSVESQARRRVPTRSCRSWIDRRGSPNGSTSTSS